MLQKGTSEELERRINFQNVYGALNLIRVGSPPGPPAVI